MTMNFSVDNGMYLTVSIIDGELVALAYETAEDMAKEAMSIGGDFSKRPEFDNDYCKQLRTLVDLNVGESKDIYGFTYTRIS